VWAAEVYRRLGGKGIHIVTADVPDAAKVDAAHPTPFTAWISSACPG
jgi:phosphatidylinositol alpha-1,6-mannosyltransferase